MDASDQRPMIVGGDFNIPPGSIYSQPLDKRFADVFAEVGTGYGFTFPTRFRWLRLDRFYVTRDWQPVSFQVLPEMGSDHRPIMTEVYLRQSKWNSPVNSSQQIVDEHFAVGRYEFPGKPATAFDVGTQSLN